VLYNGFPLDWVCRGVLLVEVLRVIKDDKLHLSELGKGVSDACDLLVCIGHAGIYLEMEITPVVVSVMVIPVKLDVLTATRTSDTVVCGDARDDLT
jgi:hypothetical protein